jgi:hypothetical protein
MASPPIRRFCRSQSSAPVRPYVLALRDPQHDLGHCRILRATVVWCGQYSAFAECVDRRAQLIAQQPDQHHGGQGGLTPNVVSHKASHFEGFMHQLKLPR